MGFWRIVLVSFFLTLALLRYLASFGAKEDSKIFKDLMYSIVYLLVSFGLSVAFGFAH